MRLPAIAGIFAILATTLSSSAPPYHSTIDRFPRMFVWAWERPEDLRDLDREIGVAFLAQTISITGDGFHVAPRRQPLGVSPDTTLIAVTRIESRASGGSTPARTQVDPLAAAIAATAQLPRVAAVQVDFDAVASERPMYRELIRRLRDQLPAGVPISITALASWCVGDDWLGGLPIDEAVPMLFRMGPANEPFRPIAMSRGSAVSACRTAVGTSLDEPIHTRTDGRRVYVFSPQSWTRLSLMQARRTIR